MALVIVEEKAHPCCVGLKDVEESLHGVSAGGDEYSIISILEVPDGVKDREGGGEHSEACGVFELSVMHDASEYNDEEVGGKRAALADPALLGVGGGDVSGVGCFKSDSLVK